MFLFDKIFGLRTLIKITKKEYIKFLGRNCV
ncbi:hypothetical protein SDC9_30500 [bioreactor metagenome]|uniref:Uncharacterized protein n=1 Tax=bioreactor metagenome TaxID=1076179 RepID=A0A644V0K4_9ZZZZ